MPPRLSGTPACTGRATSRTQVDRLLDGKKNDVTLASLQRAAAVVGRRFVKKQQMNWTLRGAHLLLQTRTKALNNELEDVFRRWYPQFRAQAA